MAFLPDVNDLLSVFRKLVPVSSEFGEEGDIDSQNKALTSLEVVTKVGLLSLSTCLLGGAVANPVRKLSLGLENSLLLVILVPISKLSAEGWP